ncbi:hypothetical protein LA76x_4663 [Lysobacter antibioticus]|uniref:Uncharacterized protein n=1 Tax=Lysobacter antibioticus TaxID=84531 RepID=A0A0S2FGU2_LYSAN|nr:hypothetical protein LA76x_4663 [Lysobacter antibioticus]
MRIESPGRRRWSRRGERIAAGRSCGLRIMPIAALPFQRAHRS